MKVLSEIDKSGIRINRIIDVLLQFHVAQEETKYGFDIEEIVNLFTANPVESWSNIRFRGIMGMATFTNNEVLIKSEFQQLENIFRFLKEEFFLNDQNFNIKSYGMSSDYNLAIKTGSNMICFTWKQNVLCYCSISKRRGKKPKMLQMKVSFIT